MEYKAQISGNPCSGLILPLHPLLDSLTERALLPLCHAVNASIGVGTECKKGKGIVLYSA